MTPLDCPTCGKAPTAEHQCANHSRRVVLCRGCYDPTPMDSLSRNPPRGSVLMGRDATEAEAIDDWNQSVIWYLESELEREGTLAREYYDDGEHREANIHRAKAKVWEEALEEAQRQMEREP